ncbi:MAG: efflux RND transporter permease subunit [Gammaproteobacteria bacterium]|nr:efflux RND transporter permease subunit [Gammaproteobacteria bacterium]
MNLPTFCIRRPAFTIVISLVMIIVGMIGFMNLPVRWIPNVNPPQVTISTTYPGASARLVEHDVTKVIEDTLSGINGIEMLTSTSRQSESQISIKFKLGRNMDTAVEDVRGSLERVRGALPKDVQNPIVTKADPNSDAVLYISFSDSHRNERELSDYIDKYIVPSFETIDGVSNVWVYGKRISAMRVWLDPAKMAAANVTADEVAQLLHDQNASIPSGQIRALDRYYSVITDTALKTPEQFNDLIIRDNQNRVVRIKDIGEAKLDVEDTDSAFRINGKPGIALGIVPQSTANPLDVEQQVKKVFADIKHSLPVGMEANIIYNQADYIRASIHSVYESFIEAVIFVWLVILVFLCSFRATLIPIITIPVCLISTFALLYFLGFSINTITLMAFVLAIGLVVDDAIVMLENISRHMEEGMSAFNAALKGSREIIFSIIAMTLTLAAVYAPIAFTPGLLGVLFREFTFTLAGAVVISGIVALTLSPMMCARILNKANHHNRYSQWQARQLLRLQNQYQRILHFLLEKRKWVIFCLVLIAGIGLGVYKFLPSELAPAEDMNSIYVSIAAPRSASFQYTDSYVHQMEALYKEIPEIDSYLSMSGMRSASHAFQLLILKPQHERKRSIEDIVRELTNQASSISGVRVNVFAPPPPLAEVAGGDEGDNMGLVLMTSSDYRKLQQSSKQTVDAIRQLPMFTHVENSLRWDSEQFQVNIDRERAADLRVSIPSITNTLSNLIAGKIVGKTDDANIWLQLNKVSLADPNVFRQIYVRNDDGKMLPLSSVLTVSSATTSEVYKHFERLRSDIIYLTLAPNYKVSEAIQSLQNVIKENISDDMKYSFTGEAKSFLESNGKTVFTFLLALVFIYLVLVAQFESFIDPFIIMFTVPFAMVGAMITLKIFDGSLNIYSNIGLITLVGLIAKHGILITDFANRLRMTGMSVQDAIIQAAILRLRPILMTTAAMVLGALPLAFAFGPGAESRQQIGLVIAGGLLFGTFFSLIVVPIAYTYLAPFRKVIMTASEWETVETAESTGNA